MEFTRSKILASSVFRHSPITPLSNSSWKRLPLSYVGVDPSSSDSNRDYRQSVVSGFVQDFFRATSRLSVNVGLRYDFYSNPTEADGRQSGYS